MRLLQWASEASETVAHKHVPVTMGSPVFKSRRAGSCEVTQAWFAPNTLLAPHTHERTIFAVMVGGSFETYFNAKRLDCLRGSAWTEPLGERHANRAGPRGARVVVVQPDQCSDEVFRPYQALFSEVHSFRDARLESEARRLVSELEWQDRLAPLALEAIAFSMFAAAARQKIVQERGSPGWLGVVRDQLHETFRCPPTVTDLANQAGVHPSHLCHEFKRRFGGSIGEYMRTLRLNWALDRLLHTSDGISDIACEAGYSDQAHFTRSCRRETGTTPAAYRKACRVGERGRSQDTRLTG